MHRRFYPLWVALLGGLLILPLLGAYGLWDPAEITDADLAQQVARTGSFFDTTLAGKHPPRPVLHVWLIAAGLKVFGVSELAARLPLALCGLVGLLLAYYLGRRLVDAKTGLAAAFVLLTTPAYLFQARQLSSEISFYVSLLAAAGGLAAFLWPADGRRRRTDLVIGGLGLVAGFLARGLVLGSLFPVLAVCLVVGLGWDIGACANDDRSGQRRLGGTLKLAWPGLLVTLLASGGIIGLLFARLHVPAAYLLLGDRLHAAAVTPGFDQPLREIGYGAFPWIALAPLAIGGFVWAQRSAHRPVQGRHPIVELLVVVLLVLGYLLAAVWPVYMTTLRFPALPWLAFGVGFWIVQNYRLRKPFWGVAVAGLLVVLQQDFFVNPASLAFSHLLAQPKYPIELDIRPAVRAFGIAFAVLLTLAVAGPQAKPAGASSDTSDTTVRDAPRPTGWRTVCWLACVPLRWVALSWNKLAPWLWPASGLVALAFAGWCAFYLTPQLSHHMSNKALFTTYRRCRGPHDRLAQYQVAGRGASYYTDGDIDQISSQSELLTRLRGATRLFALVPASRLGGLDQAARRDKVRYFVLDDRNSQVLIISNRLGGACRTDLNPLRKLVRSKPPTPQHLLSANFEHRVELIGYDMPRVVRSGGKFRVVLYFKVLGTVPSNYQIFMHFDKPASRFHGDHKPLGDKYPTQYWLPGDYIVDPHDIDLPLLTTSPGTYTVYVGFWLGSKRLKVVQGPNDGADRVRMATLRVKTL